MPSIHLLHLYMHLTTQIKIRIITIFILTLHLWHLDTVCGLLLGLASTMVYTGAGLYAQ